MTRTTLAILIYIIATSANAQLCVDWSCSVMNPENGPMSRSQSVIDPYNGVMNYENSIMNPNRRNVIRDGSGDVTGYTRERRGSTQYYDNDGDWTGYQIHDGERYE